MMNGWLGDLRLGLRALLRAPAFASVAILTLALGMAANTAIFTVIDAVVLDALPYAEPERRIMIWSRWRGFDKTWTNPFESLAYAEGCPSLERVAYWQTGAANLTGDGEPVRVAVGWVTAGAFDTLGARPLLGRGFAPEEDRPEGPPVAVLGHALWQGRYGGDPGILGRLVSLDGVPHEVVGVMPPGFALPTDFREHAADPTQLWTPRATEPEELLDPDGHSDYAAGVLAPGADVARVNDELRAAADRFVSVDPFYAETRFTAFAVPLREEIVGPYRPALLLLAGAVAFLLLIACANVANLLLARAEARHREMAVRTAVGAGRGRLVRQLLTEGLVLALVSAALGLLLAQAGLGLLEATVPVRIPRALAAGVNVRALVFTTALSCLTTLLFALAPALHTLRHDLASSLKEGGRHPGGLARRRWRSALIVAESAFAVLLAVGAGLMARSLHGLGQIDLGLDPQGVLTASLALPRSDYETPDQVSAFHRELLREVRVLPGVEAAGLLRLLPLGQTIGTWGITVEGSERLDGLPIGADWQVASSGAAEALHLRLRRGRLISDGDVVEAPQVAVINEAMARHAWPGQEPLGRRFRMGSEGRPWITVVGVVADVRHNGLTGVVKPKFYRPMDQYPVSTGYPLRNVHLVARTASDPLALVPSLRAALRRIAPGVPLAGVRAMEEVVAGSIAAPRFAGSLLALFGTLALGLAAVGIYGVLSYTVNERAAEIGVRMVLGARPGEVALRVVGEALALAAAGVGAGVALALLLTRLMRSLLHEVAPGDPLTLAAAALALLAVALVASWRPARRAATLDPAVALRHE